MSTLKMTFSLASLILILGLVFVTAPAMAQSTAITTSTGANAADSTRSIDWTLTFAADATDTIPAGGYMIIHKGALSTDATAPGGLPSAATLGSSVVTVDAAATMPDLERLFFEEGGTILLQASTTNLDADGALIAAGTFGVGLRPTEAGFTEYRYDHDGDDVGSTGEGAHASAVANDGIKDNVDPTPAAVTATTNPATPVQDVSIDDLMITEIMWALDNAIIGQAAADDRQWIEIHNRNENVALPVRGLVLRIASAHPALGFDTAVVATGSVSARRGADRIENVRAVGLEWEPKGQSGVSAPDTALMPFVSMHRTRSGDSLKKDGGSNIGHWTASTQVYFANHKGTPGKKERGGVVNFTTKGFDLGTVIINEVANRTNAHNAYEWIELKGPKDTNLKNWQMSLLTGVDVEVPLFTFPDADRKIPESGLLLVVDSDPSGKDGHPLAAGWNIAKGADGQVEGVGVENPDDPRYAARYIVLPFEGDGLPDNGDFVLVLRSGKDKIKKNEKIVDIAGYADDLTIPNTDPKFTNLWPLQGDVRNAMLSNNRLGTKHPADEGPKLADAAEHTGSGAVHRRQKTDIWGTSSANYGRKHHDVAGNHHDDAAFRNVGWTGIGYKRNALDFSGSTMTNLGGTPGYPNDAIKNDGAMAISAVMISEIMYAPGDRGLVQWVELRNMSDMVGVNLGSWRLEVVNHHKTMDDAGMMNGWDGKYTDHVDLSGTIPPGQTYLIVSRKTSRHNTELPDGRIVEASGLKRGEELFNPYGFQLRLIAKRGEAAAKQEEVDIVGNLKPKPAGVRREDAQSFNDEVAWMLPDALTEDGERVSLIRIPTKGLAKSPTGTDKPAWRLYNMTKQYDSIRADTYYGHDSDISSPGHYFGGVLPVSLSKFRPERMKDTGEIVIRWITESELNNAGFNILRSEKRDGEFTKINTKLIAGQGTTSERTTYTYTDTSAKPNVVYYYQIQDVSLDGQVQTLRTTHLRGNVTAVGKATTTWGELKALQ